MSHHQQQQQQQHQENINNNINEFPRHLIKQHFTLKSEVCRFFTASCGVTSLCLYCFLRSNLTVTVASG